MTARPMTEISELTCPFCGRDPFHYVDNGVGMEAVAVTCCELGNEYFRGARDDPEEVTLSWEDFRDIGNRLLSTSAAVWGMREALEKIARQTLSVDMSVDDQLGGDFEGAYNYMIEDARAALEPGEDEQARPSGSAPASTVSKDTTK